MRAWLPSARRAASRASASARPRSRCSSASISRWTRSSRSRSSWSAMSHPDRCPHHARDRRREPVPLRFFGGELLPPERREPVVLAFALLRRARFPFRGDEGLALEPVEGGIEGAVLEAQDLVGRPLNVLGDLVAVRGAEQQRPKNEHVERALQQSGAIL